MKTKKILCLLTCLSYLGCQADDTQQRPVKRSGPPEVEPEKPVPKKQFFEELPRAIPKSAVNLLSQDLAEVNDLFSKLNGTWIGEKVGIMRGHSRTRFDFDGATYLFSGICQFGESGVGIAEIILRGKVEIAEGKLLLIVNSSILEAHVGGFLAYCGDYYIWPQNQDQYRLAIPIGLHEQDTLMTFHGRHIGQPNESVNSVFFKRDAK